MGFVGDGLGARVWVGGRGSIKREDEREGDGTSMWMLGLLGGGLLKVRFRHSDERTLFLYSNSNKGLSMCYINAVSITMPWSMQV